MVAQIYLVQSILIKTYLITKVKRYTPSKVDRSANVIFFSIPEQDILHTRSLIDEACVHLVGKDIPINDLYRLGKQSRSEDVNHPRPVLVKFLTVWDRRLILLSKRKLKDFRLSRIFVRPDLSPEERRDRRQISIAKPADLANTPNPSIDNTSSHSSLSYPGGPTAASVSDANLVSND